MLLPVLNSSPAWYGSERSALEEELAIRLQRLHRIAGGYLRAIEYYNGELDSEEGQIALVNHLRASHVPAVLIATGNSTYEGENTTRRDQTEHLSVEVLFCSAHLRSLPSRLRGDVAARPEAAADEYGGRDPAHADPTLYQNDPGIYRMMRDVRSLVNGRDSSVDGCGVWVLKREAVVIQLPLFTLWRAQYIVPYHWIRETVEDEVLASPTSAAIGYHLADETVGNPVLVQEIELP